MIKKLDILIIKAFIGPFLATFLISLFVLIMQFFWLYIDDLVGKGLEAYIILKLIVYVAATLIPMALPLALLLSSIMTFGNLGETFEIVAIKSAGIPLLRFMRPLIIVTVVISGIAFLFANNIIPVAQLKLASTKYNIIVSKPSFDIKEGTFYNKIEGFVIRLGKKEKDDSTIRNIIIYKRKYGLQDDIITAESGVMRTTSDKKYLEFTLQKGFLYQEKGPQQTTNTQFVRMGFKNYKMLFDLRGFQMSKQEDSIFRYDPKMLSIRQLNNAIDSLEVTDSIFYRRSKIEIDPYFNFTKFKDTGWVKIAPTLLKKNKPFVSIMPDSVKFMVYERSMNQINTIKSNVNSLSESYIRKQQTIRYHAIEWHRKFTLSVACMVLFLIGAPLGSIIRKGGLGTPLVFAIIFFVVFHLLNTFGEKFSKEEVTSVFIGMWLSTLILIPVGFFLTYKAMRDSQLFNQEAYYRFFKMVRTFITNYKNKQSST
ncbi:MAG: LptF/LptG family permease [Deinococcales bacterium]|nr:LptF/LptG family permease [Chitinophagaceae bacterium]